MKALFVVGDFLPHKNAGIENYTYWWLRNLGVDIHCDILIVNSTSSVGSYFFEGINVRRISNFFEFKEIALCEYKFIHFMELSGKKGINSKYFEYAKRFTRVFFTFHLPYFLCVKGDLRYLGKSNCSSSNFFKCTECLFNSNSSLLSKSKGLLRYKLDQIELNKVIEYSDRIFFYADWFFSFCINSGLNITKFHKVPYLKSFGINNIQIFSPIPRKKIVFVGRIEESKGLLLLCKALENNGDIQIDVLGNIVDKGYFDKCSLIANINYLGTVSRDELTQSLINYDLLVLPSVFSEMASMVLLQAILQHVPVLVSSALGNLELVENYRKALVFDYGDYVSLRKNLFRFYENYAFYSRGDVIQCEEVKDLFLIREYGFPEDYYLLK